MLVRPLCRPQVSLTGVDKYAEGVAKLFNQEESRCGPPTLRPAGSFLWLFVIDAHRGFPLKQENRLLYLAVHAARLC